MRSTNFPNDLIMVKSPELQWRFSRVIAALIGSGGVQLLEALEGWLWWISWSSGFTKTKLARGAMSLSGTISSHVYPLVLSAPWWANEDWLARPPRISARQSPTYVIPDSGSGRLQQPRWSPHYSPPSLEIKIIFARGCWRRRNRRSEEGVPRPPRRGRGG